MWRPCWPGLVSGSSRGGSAAGARSRRGGEEGLWVARPWVINETAEFVSKEKRIDGV